MQLNRIVIYAKDIGRITGKSDRHARTILNDIRKKHGKQKHQFVTLAEFCTHTGLNPEDVTPYLF